MKINTLGILNKALGTVTPGEFGVLYYVLNGMRLSNSPELRVCRDVMLDAFGGKLSSRNLSKWAESLASRGYFTVSKSKNNFYTFTLLNATVSRKEPTTKKEEYYQQLEHPLWLRKREKILKRDQYQCCLCGSKNNLQVHHLKYSRDKKAWQYPDLDLITLCEECHKKVHADPQHDLNPYKK